MKPFTKNVYLIRFIVVLILFSISIGLKPIECFSAATDSKVREIPANAPWEFKEIAKVIPDLHISERAASHGIEYIVAHYKTEKYFLLMVSSFDEKTLSDVKKILKVFYPTEYETVYNHLLDAGNNRKNIPGMFFDGRTCDCRYSAAVASVKIGELESRSEPEPVYIPIKVILNGNQLSFDVPPIIKDGRVLVPFRAIGEAMGAQVGWEGQTQTVTLTLGDTIVKLRIGDAEAYVNGRLVNLDVPAQIIDGRTLVPVRFISEAFGARVDWDEASRTVYITTSVPDSVTPKIILNGNEIKFKEAPFFENNTVLVPMRELYEVLGMDVSWDNTTKRAIAVKEDTTIEFVAGQSTATLNGQDVSLGTATKIIDNTVFVPLKFICESIGANYSWDNGNKTAIITANLNKELKIISALIDPKIVAAGEEIVVIAKVQGDPSKVELIIPQRNINVGMYQLAGWLWGTYGIKMTEPGSVQCIVKATGKNGESASITKDLIIESN